jgi:lysophospholipase L1-like esterase
LHKVTAPDRTTSPWARRLVQATAIVGIGLVLTGGALLARSWVLRELRPRLLAYLAANLTDEERRDLYEELARSGGTLWDTDPDPEVARLAKRDGEFEYKGARVRTNNAGFRSERSYVPKPAGVFRVVCLGDSFVFGEAGLEEDRLCDQMEAFYREHGVRVGARRVEVYSLGLPSWTLLQEARYLTRRLSEYDPDVVLVLSTANDITDNFGVTGAGTLTTSFSPERRSLGSAVFTNQQALRWGNFSYTALTTDVCGEARSRWRRAMAELRSLVELQDERGGRTLLALLLHTTSAYFVEIYKGELEQAGIDAPLLLTDFFWSPETKLEHDDHPNRAGHAIVSHHFVHALSKLGWIPVAADLLPPLEPRLSLELQHPPDPLQRIRARDRFVRKFLRTELDLQRLAPEDAIGLLGGVILDRGGSSSQEGLWSSVRSGFVLRREEGSREVAVEIALPKQVELFPIEISMRVNGSPATRRTFGMADGGGTRTLRGALPPATEEDPEAVEVLLEASSHVSRIVDGRMRSFQLLSARVQ